jgi:hypothetical protein
MNNHCNKQLFYFHISLVHKPINFAVVGVMYYSFSYFLTPPERGADWHCDQRINQLSSASQMRQVYQIEGC